MTTRSYRVSHRTAYQYSATMSDGYTVVNLTPRSTKWQHVRESHVELVPMASGVDMFVDVFGNIVHQFGLHEPHATMVVEAISLVDVIERAMPVDATPWEAVVDDLDGLIGPEAIDVSMFRSQSTFVDLAALGGTLRAYAFESFTPGQEIVAAALSLCERIYREFQFDSQFSTVSTPLSEVINERRGVCQDFAHLAVGCLRSLGLAARYISGYIETKPPPGKPRLVGTDASHAWVSVWTPLAGWVDFDPTNGHLPVNDHITVAWGRDYADVIPVRGVMIGPATEQKLKVSVDVAPV
ncbi:MAG TPA: transglutaminase family protein [Ilumatobacter sp.]|nr:transglutaminase family protein [Ilumatobacter sp.]